MSQSVGSGRHYGPLDADTPEAAKLAEYLRNLVKVHGVKQRELARMIPFGKSAISRYLKGKVPPQAFVDALIDAVVPPQQRVVGRRQARSLLYAANHPAELPVSTLTTAVPDVRASLKTAELVRRDSVREDAERELARAGTHVSALQRDLNTTQQLVLLLTQLALSLDNQVTALQAKLKETEEVSPAAALHLELLSQQLHLAHEELARAQAARADAEHLADQAQRYALRLHEKLISADFVPTAPDPVVAGGLRLDEEALLADPREALRTAARLLDQSDEERTGLRVAMGSQVGLGPTVDARLASARDRWQITAVAAERALGCVLMMLGGLALLPAHGWAWPVITTTCAGAGILLLADPWRTARWLWVPLRAMLRRETLALPLPVSVQQIAVAALRCLTGAAAGACAWATGAAVLWWGGQWPLLTLSGALLFSCHTVVARDQQLFAVAREASAELSVDLAAPVVGWHQAGLDRRPSVRRPVLRLGGESLLRVLDPEWAEARGQEIDYAFTEGWSSTARWIRFVAGAMAVLALYVVAGWVLPALARAGVDARASTLIRTMDDPVRVFITAHTRGLPITVHQTYTLWVVGGAVTWLLAWQGRSFAARSTWMLWAGGTGFMVWQATAPAGRPIAVGVTALAWGAASLYALKGLTLRGHPTTINQIVQAPRDDEEEDTPKPLTPTELDPDES